MALYIIFVKFAILLMLHSVICLLSLLHHRYFVVYVTTMYLALFHCNDRRIRLNNIIICSPYVSDGALSLIYCSFITAYALLIYLIPY